MPYDDSIPDSTLLTLHPEIKAAVSKKGFPPTVPPTRATIASIRKRFAAANARLNTSRLARDVLGCADPEDATKRYWDESDHQVPVRDGSHIHVRIHRPKSRPQSGIPVVVLMHGGGWIMGDWTTEALLARAFCTRLGVLVVNVGFRNYPEVEFGVPVLDCFDVVKWTATEGTVKKLGGNCEVGFVLAGVSGGGCYAAICAHFARDEGLNPPVTGQWLTCPVIETLTKDKNTGEIRDDSFSKETVNRSVVQNKDAPLMNAAMEKAIRGFADFDPRSNLLTPLTFDSHENLGRGGVYVQVAGLDPWRDSGRIYAALCEKDGNKIRTKVYSGLPHCWWTFFHALKVTRDWVDDCVGGLRWLLVVEKESVERQVKL